MNISKLNVFILPQNSLHYVWQAGCSIPLCVEKVAWGPWLKLGHANTLSNTSQLPPLCSSAELHHLHAHF